jgi:DNA-binding response OmpR family regulator
MAANILVVTYDSPMGEFIRAGLEERGQFHILVTSELKKAVTFLLETDCTLALIDPGEKITVFPPFLRRLRETRPAMQVIMLAEANWQELLEEIKADNTIYKPFSLPELITAVGKIYPLEEIPALATVPESVQKLPAWLSNVNRAANRLRQLSLESFSQAALITENDQLWAYAGQLPQEAARELAATIAR